ncbi:MAG: hypothetical protein ACLUKE_07780 [Blautia wexlerae]
MAKHFVEDTLDKIKDIRRRSTDTGEWKDIEVDGSINCGNIGKVIKAGANIIVSGKALFNGNLAREHCQYEATGSHGGIR